MKITKTFENATLRTVNNGYIELDYNGKTHCFNNASVVSVNNGSISIEVDWEPEKGELIKVIGYGINCYVIFTTFNTSSNILYTYGSINMNLASTGYFELRDTLWACDYRVQLLPVTPEEQQAFDDFCKSQGKIWNKEKLQWEKYQWKPVEDQVYYTIFGDGLVYKCIWNSSKVARDRYALGNCFETKEEAEKVAEKVKGFFKSL